MTPLARSWAGFVAILRAELADLFQYRIVMFLYAMWGVINPVIYLAVWAAVSGEGRVGGFGRDDFVLYYLIFMIVTHLTGTVEVYTIGPSIESGRMSARLLRPMHPFLGAAAMNVAYKSVSLLLLIPVWVVMFAVLRPPFTGDVLSIVLGLIALLLAILLTFLVGSALAMLAFWTTRSMSIHDIWMRVTFLLGGTVAPVAALPGFVQVMAVALPFRYTIGFPIEVVMGRLSPAELALGFGLLLGWTAVAAAAFGLIWRAGIKHYSAVGA